MNRSRQHPKLVGFPASGTAVEAPAPEPSYPTDPRWASNDAGVKNVRAARDSAEREDLVDEVRVRQDDAAAAVSREAEFVEDPRGRVAAPRPHDERFVCARDDLAAREASDGDDHALTGTTSAASCAPRGRGGSSGVSGGCRGRSTCGRTPGTGSRAPGRSGTARGLGRSRCASRRPGP